MTRLNLVFILSLQTLCAAWLGAMGCSSSNPPATSSVTGGANATGGSTATSMPVGGTSASGGASASTSTKASTGGTPAGGVGGATGTAGSPSGSTSEPDGACGNTTAGTAIAKAVACGAGDTQLCDKLCGPDNVGYKTETCSAGAYVEGPCVFPSGVNYSCFKVPTADSASCPTTEPQHGTACNLTLCSTPCAGTACEMCGVAAGYLDSSGNQKTGYCVCIAGSTGGKWSCASSTAWPCPAGLGCT